MGRNRSQRNFHCSTQQNISLLKYAKRLPTLVSRFFVNPLSTFDYCADSSRLRCHVHTIVTAIQNTRSETDRHRQPSFLSHSMGWLEWPRCHAANWHTGRADQPVANAVSSPGLQASQRSHGKHLAWRPESKACNHLCRSSTSTTWCIVLAWTMSF
jgi:hypothetical protein